MIKKFIQSAEKMLEISRVPDGKVFILGGGEKAESLRKELKNISVEVSAFLSEEDDHGFCTKANIPTLPLIEINEIPKEKMFICCAAGSDDDYFEKRRQLEDCGLKECLHFGDFSSNPDSRLYSDGYDFMEVPVENLDLRYKYLKVAASRYKQGINQPVIDSETIVVNAIDLKLTTKCTYNCKHCSAATSYIKAHKTFDATQIVDDLDNMLEVVYTPLIVILGGEPLLHPLFGQVVRGLTKMKNLNHVGRFMMLSNATVLPAVEDLQYFRDLPAAEIIINDYARASQKVNEYSNLCEKAGVTHKVNFEGKKVWFDFGDFTQCRNYSEEQLRHLRYICDASAVLYDGRFYSCCRAAALEENGLMPLKNDDFVDIRNSDNSLKLKDELWHYLYDRPHLSPCNYCSGSHIAAKQIPVGS